MIVIGITPGRGEEVLVNCTSTSIDACTSLVNVYSNDVLYNQHTFSYILEIFSTLDAQLYKKNEKKAKAESVALINRLNNTFSNV